MDPVILARAQFAITIGFHYIFPPITIGMGWMIFAMKTMHLARRDEVWGALARFWTRVFAISFAVGVATGIVMEFQFGTNWAAYSRFVGDVFGAPLAAEGILAFFLESTFLGLLLYGEKRISPRLHWLASLMVALGATLSAFWIIVANSWQQTPAGYEIVGGRAVLTDFWAAVFNPSTVERYLHVITGAMCAGTMFVLGVSSWWILKGRHGEAAIRSARMALIAAALSAIAQLATGHYQAVQVFRTQPAKLAAFEGQFETRRGAPMIIVGLPDAEARRTRGEIGIPYMLSLLVGLRPDTEVKGLNEFPKEHWPPLVTTFMSFRGMEALGFWFIGLTLAGLVLLYLGRLAGSGWWLRAAIATAPLPIAANELGWIAAEVGRQPWIVWGEMMTRDAVSVSVPAWQIAVSIAAFCAIYAVILGAWLFLIARRIGEGPATVRQ